MLYRRCVVRRTDWWASVLYGPVCCPQCLCLCGCTGKCRESSALNVTYIQGCTTSFMACRSPIRANENINKHWQCYLACHSSTLRHQPSTLWLLLGPLVSCSVLGARRAWVFSLAHGLLDVIEGELWPVLQPTTRGQSRRIDFLFGVRSCHHNTPRWSQLIRSFCFCCSTT